MTAPRVKAWLCFACLIPLVAACGMRGDLRRPEEAKAREERRSKHSGNSFFGFTSVGPGKNEDSVPPPARPEPAASDAPKAEPAAAPAGKSPTSGS